MTGHGIGVTVHLSAPDEVGFGVVGLVGSVFQVRGGVVLFTHSHHCGLQVAPVPLQDHLSVPSHFSPRFGSYTLLLLQRFSPVSTLPVIVPVDEPINLPKHHLHSANTS